MKKIDFSFRCEQNHDEMPATGNTRYCGQCNRNIMDFTGMTPAQITAYIRSNKHACGFMRPGQLRLVNEHLQQERSAFIRNRLSRVIQLAAMFSTPLFAGNVYAQTGKAVVNQAQNTPGESGQHNEILVLARDGSPLTGLVFEVYDSQQQLLLQTGTNASGRLYISPQLAEKGSIVLKNQATGLEKTFVFKSGAVCQVWQTRLAAREEKQAPVTHACGFTLSVRQYNGKTGTLRQKEVTVELYDSTSGQTVSKTLTTGKNGGLDISDSELKNVSHLRFTISLEGETYEAYVYTSSIDLQKNTPVELRGYEHVWMGIVVETP